MEKNFALKVRWNWGLQEYYYFSTKKERSDWLSKREDDIEHAIAEMKGWYDNVKNKSFDVMDDMTNYEMDMYL